MNVTQQVSALPWSVGAKVKTGIYDANNGVVTLCDSMGEGKSDAVNAAFIAKACSAHPKLVEVLKAVRDLLQADRHIPLFLIEAALLEAGEPV